MRATDDLYLGGYWTEDGKFVLKIGTSNDIEVRESQHNRYYKTAKNYPIAKDSRYKMFESIPLSKYNALRFEDSNKARWIEEGFGTYIKNDRFVFDEIPSEIHIFIKKEYVFYTENWEF